MVKITNCSEKGVTVERETKMSDGLQKLKVKILFIPTMDPAILNLMVILTLTILNHSQDLFFLICLVIRMLKCA